MPYIKTDRTPAPLVRSLVRALEGASNPKGTFRNSVRVLLTARNGKMANGRYYTRDQIEDGFEYVAQAAHARGVDEHLICAMGANIVKLLDFTDPR